MGANNALGITGKTDEDSLLLPIEISITVRIG